jgi:hypothetical protein
MINEKKISISSPSKKERDKSSSSESFFKPTGSFSPDYNLIKLSINSGIVSQIYSQLCASFTDFYGFLLGRYKIIKNVESIDSNSNFEQNILSLVVDNVIFIYDKNYLKDKLEKLLEKIYRKYTIVGLFSARSYSYTNISLKEQEFFLKAMNFLKNDKKVFNNVNIGNIPLLFGSFCHNITEENFENKVKTVNFYSKIFQYNDKK